MEAAILTFEVVPETPEEASRNRTGRRSSRRSTMMSTAASDARGHTSAKSHRRVAETPDLSGSGGSGAAAGRRGRRRRTVTVPESPADEADDALGGRRTSSQTSSLAVVHQRHPLFQGGARELESEETFVQYVAATQDLASTHLNEPGNGGVEEGEDKVTRWLRENDAGVRTSKARNKALLSPKKRDELAGDLCRALMGGEGGSRETPETTVRKQSRRRRSSILENAGNSPVGSPLRASPAKMGLHASFASTQRSSEQRCVRRSVAGVLQFLEEEDEERPMENGCQDDVFFRPTERRSLAIENSMEETACVGGIKRLKSGASSAGPSYQALGGGLVDFSSDSAKALIAEYKSRFKGGDSQGSEDSAKAASEAGLVRTRSGAMVDFSTDSAKALIAAYEAGLANSSSRQSGGDPPGNEGEDEEDLPATQPSLSVVLQGVTAYVEFRSGHDNRSRCVEEVLESMGAVVSSKLCKGVTHMIFKDGSLTTYNKAKKMGIYIVGLLWVEACRKECARVSEGLFPTTSKEKYDSPGLFPKIRKAKSMQPKSEEELRQKLDSQLRRKQRKKKSEDATVAEEDSEAPAPKPAYPVPLDFYNSPRVNSPSRATKKRDSVLNILDEARGDDDAVMMITSPARARLNASQDSDKVPGSPCTSDDFNTPLARRLINKYFSPVGGAGSGKKGDSLRRQAHTCNTEIRQRQNCSYDSNADMSVVEEIADLDKVVSEVEVLSRKDSRDEASKSAENDSLKENRLKANHVCHKGASEQGSEVGQSGESIHDLEEVPDGQVLTGFKEVSLRSSRFSNADKPTKSKQHNKRKVSCQRIVDLEDLPPGKVAAEEAGTSADAGLSEDIVLLKLSFEEEEEEQHAAKETGKRQYQPTRKPLFSQKDILSETPSATPATKLTAENVHAKTRDAKTKKSGKARTKLIKASDCETVAKPPECEFAKPDVGERHKRKRGRLRKEGSAESKTSSSSGKSARSTASRRSSVDFVKEDSSSSRRHRKSTQAARYCVLGTSLAPEDAQLLRQLVARLGRFALEDGPRVTAATSHVVCGVPARRTLNLLRGLTRGCWLLSRDWLFASLERGRWADEEEFEMADFSPWVRRTRQERQAFGRRSVAFLADLPLMHFSPRGCRAPVDELRNLAALAGAATTKVSRAAGMVVGEKVRRQSSDIEVCVSETWLFDSLQRQECLPFDDYLLQ